MTELFAHQAMQKWPFKQYLPQGQKNILFPDQHLGRNTALSLGVKKEEVKIMESFQRKWWFNNRRNSKVKVLVWQGHCSVHTRFSVDQIDEAKLRGANVIVHPECTNEVVSVSDYVGSTEYIIDVVNNAESGTKWGVGTEINLVKRLASQNPDKEIFLPRSNCLPLCNNVQDSPGIRSMGARWDCGWIGD